MKFFKGGFAQWSQCVGRVAADFLFPLLCVGCKIEGTVLCVACAEHLSYAMICACPWCGAPQRYGMPCAGCADALHLNAVIGCFNYHEKIIAELIKMWKYHGIGAAREQILLLLEKVADNAPWIRAWARDAVLAPIPLHKRRLCERGFNQAEDLARAWERILRIPVVDCLARQISTPAQAQQAGTARQKISQNIFIVRKNVSIPRKVILIDDVYTTGATLDRAAQMLKNAGAEEVYGLVFARET